MPDAVQGTTRADVLARLQTTLDHADLPDRLRLSGRALAERLASPVRLSFLGRPEAGKTTLIRALLGSDVPALNGNAPSYELGYGPIPKARVTLEDGTHQEVTTAQLEEVLTQEPLFVEVEHPCPALEKLRVLEVVTDGSAAELSAAAPWAAERSEIPIWCSRNFDGVEKEIWSRVPANRKDHAMLVLTQADTLAKDVLAARLEQAFDRDGTGFSIIAPVAARPALEAEHAKRPNADTVAKACGIAALRQEIFRRVDQGRQADLDHAEIFLSRFENRAARPPSLPVRVPDGATVGSPSPIMKTGADYVRQQARDMLIDIEEFGPFAPGKIVERCLETANTLVDMIADDAPLGAAQALAHAAALDAADILLLMTLENTDGAAEDAVNLMLQIKQEFEMAA